MKDAMIIGKTPILWQAYLADEKESFSGEGVAELSIISPVSKVSSLIPIIS